MPSYLLHDKPGSFSFLLCNLLHFNSLCELLPKCQMCLKETRRESKTLEWTKAIKYKQTRERSLPEKRHLG